MHFSSVLSPSPDPTPVATSRFVPATSFTSLSIILRVFGPMLIATLREANGRYNEALVVIAAVMLVATAIPMLVGAPLPPQARSAPVAGGVGA